MAGVLLPRLPLHVLARRSPLDQHLAVEYGAWLAILGWVVTYDPFALRHAYRTLSRVCWDLLDGPITGPLTAAAITGTAWHLLHRPRGH